MKNYNSKLRIKQSRKCTSGVAPITIGDSPDGGGNSKHTLVIGVSSSVAVYKAIDLIKLLRNKGIEVIVIMTEHAASMITPLKFERASGHQVYTTLFPARFNYKEILEKREVDHIKIASCASLFVVAPATANIIGKIAAGLADDFLTTALLATNAPVLICPSMNTKMWRNPLVQENVERLKKLGYYILPPKTGRLACGSVGIGRLADINVIADEVCRLLESRNRLKGKKIIVTAGGTVEPIDVVRVITNRSSGKMGVAIAEACYMEGADVLFLCSSTAINYIRVPWKRWTEDTSGVTPIKSGGSPDGGEIRQKNRLIIVEIFETSFDLRELIEKHVKTYNVLFHTAAVADFIPKEKVDIKLDSKKSFFLKLKPVPKILDQIKFWNPKILLIGFKAVYKEKEEDLIKTGLKKLRDSHSDYIIVNDVGNEGVGFGVDENEVYIISPQGLVAKVNKAPKKEVARKILEYVF